MTDKAALGQIVPKSPGPVSYTHLDVYKRQEEVQALLKRIGVDGVRYEEFFITSFDGDVLGRCV